MANVKIHLRTRRGNVNINQYVKMMQRKLDKIPSRAKHFYTCTNGNNDKTLVLII